MNRAEQKEMRRSIDMMNPGVDDMENGKTTRASKRYALSTSTLLAAQICEWIASRHFPFTAIDCAREFELSDTSARRHLRTIENVGWITRADNLPKTTRGGPQHTYRSNVRIRRLSNGD